MIKPSGGRSSASAPGAGAGRAGPPAAGNGAKGGGRRGWVLGVILAVLVLAAASLAVAALRYRHDHPSNPQLRSHGIPSNISTPLATLMGLDTVPTHPAPGFTLTDQNGQTMSLASFRGHPVILEFMDPHCTDICPIVSQEFVDAYHDLGKAGRHVVFLAVNVNEYHLGVADVAAFSRQHQLDTIPTWHFFTGALSTLQAIWTQYAISVTAPGPNADVVHTSVIYFIGPNGRERYVAEPADDHTKSGAAYLPAGQITSWGQGIATVARDLGA